MLSSQIQNDDELAAYVSQLAEPMRGGSLGEGERALHGQREVATLVEQGRVGERVPGAALGAGGEDDAAFRGPRVGDGDDAVRGPGEFDELGQDSGPRDVERAVDAGRDEPTDAIGEPRPVRNGLDPEVTQEGVIALAGGADDNEPVGTRELGRGKADTRRAVDALKAAPGGVVLINGVAGGSRRLRAPGCGSASARPPAPASRRPAARRAGRTRQTEALSYTHRNTKWGVSPHLFR
ncbi:hypothetical protein Ahu01nite_090900 [Winogradskya humida]|uniref:Uncharacterized protein n=1 Tax=Winogradskya humida TaxID=113566 RepID=A0ABQ4A5U7_9ACTN|nr:hypothetical protein Ahu01nite_090900 [Actinoplanes humidus]